MPASRGPSLVFSHDGNQIVCNVNRTIWTTTGHHLPRPETDKNLDGPGATVSVAYSPDDDKIVYGTEGGRVQLLDTVTDETHTLGSYSLRVVSLAFSSDGSCVASGSDDNTVLIWDSKLRETIDKEIAWEELRFLALSHDSVDCLCLRFHAHASWESDGRHNEGKRVKLWG